MKFRVTMKDPDTLMDAVNDAVTESLCDVADPNEKAALHEIRAEKISTAANRWFEYGEYLTVEIDTDAMTCVVVPRGA